MRAWLSYITLFCSNYVKTSDDVVLLSWQWVWGKVNAMWLPICFFLDIVIILL